MFLQASLEIFQKIANSNHASVWKSKELSYKSFKPAASNNSLASVLNHIHSKSKVKFDGSCIKQDKVTFTLKQVVNVYIVCEINFVFI